MKILQWLLFCYVLLGNVNFLQAQKIPHFTDPPQIIQNPANSFQYAVERREFTGISSLAVTSNGILWATWYTGNTPDEDHNNYVVVANSADEGKSWNEILVIDADAGGPIRTFDPEIWVDPNGKLWVFWAQAISKQAQVEIDGHISGVWAISTTQTDQVYPQWTQPLRIADGIMMCKPTVLNNGNWLLPISTWYKTSHSAKVWQSTDEGQSWNYVGGCDVPKEVQTFDEHMIIEKRNGDLWMLMRTKAGIGESISKDGGKTWTQAKNSTLAHPSARFFIRKLQSGNILLVKHGPLKTKTSRSHLMAFLSQDDGATWSQGLLIDERTGVSYPDGQQVSDGRIFITYDYDRRGAQNIMMTSFTEADILSKNSNESLYQVFQHRKIISAGGQ